jgi:hypothetical protein
MNASPGSSLNYVYKSQKSYSVGPENNFLILPDGKTIIGVDASNTNHLFMEDITRSDGSAYHQIATHGKHIWSVFYNLISKTIFVGNDGGKVIEYQQEANNQS